MYSKYSGRIKQFKPTFRIDLSTEDLEKEPTEKVEDVISLNPEGEEYPTTPMNDLFNRTGGDGSEFDDYIINDRFRWIREGLVVRNRKTGMKFFRKSYKISFSDRNRFKLVKLFKRLNRIPHPNIVSYYDYFIVDNNFYIIKEYMNCKSMELIMKFTKTVPETQIAQILHQILKAVIHIHSCFDLPHNLCVPKYILMNHYGECKLHSFGHGTEWNVLYEYKHFWCYNPNVDFRAHRPPGTWERSRIKNIDVWSLAMTAIEMFIGDDRFQKIMYNNRMDLGQPSTIDKKEFADQKQYLEIEEIERKGTPEFKDFLEMCIVSDQLKIPSSHELINHPWFLKNVRGLDPSIETKSIPSLRRWLHDKYIRVRKRQAKNMKKKK